MKLSTINLMLFKTTFFPLMCMLLAITSAAQDTRLLRQPSASGSHVAFAYGGDVWVTDLDGQRPVRITSTPAVESNPYLSPDGKLVAFTSNRTGDDAVYIAPIEGGEATRLTWHPSTTIVRGWTPDGKKILYASDRDAAPTPFQKLWTVPIAGGPSTLLSQQWGSNGSFSPDGNQIVMDRVSRWDEEWRDYRGGQNTPLVILNLTDSTETLIPNDRTVDILPVWIGEVIYFVSDRDFVSNIWSYTPKTKEFKQVTTFTGSDVKWVTGNATKLIFERDGYLHQLDIATGITTQLSVTIRGDFPWADTKWEDIGEKVSASSISPSGKRAIFESRGEIFTVPVEHGDARNITQSSGAADRAPVWSPKGTQVAWFSDANGKNYELMIADQDGLSKPKSISIGESKMAWEPAWSPDGKYIAFTDDDVRVRIVDVDAGTIVTADVGGINIERGRLGLTWSPDSKWLAYAKTGTNNFRSVFVWSQRDKSARRITDPFADTFSPAWDLDGHHLYFLASTNLALGSGWANTSSITADPRYEVYLINLRKADASPFKPQSDEESISETKPAGTNDEKSKDKKKAKKDDADDDATKEKEPVQIDFDGIERRTIAVPLPEGNYQLTIAGPAGSLFVGEQKDGASGMTLHKFKLEEREAKEFVTGTQQVSVSSDGSNMLAKIDGKWRIISTKSDSGKEGKALNVSLKMQLDRSVEWKQMFEEAWRYERDFFYDRGMHGRDWNVVYQRYAPLIPFVKHRTDLTYVLDQVNGELSVGHSFVFGGDYPDVDKSAVGLLGADLVAENGRWKIQRILTSENWNPDLSSPLDRPGIKVETGNYLVGINGKELTDAMDPFMLLDGTAERQTILHINKTPAFNGAWKETVKPIRSEYGLRRRTWVEDNRRRVDKLSDGKLAYVWVPNTATNGFVSFNRYFFAQQDKLGAIIDERFNGGGYLDDYMVDLMARKLRAAITNEVPNGKAMKLPAGILGPKVLLINEMAGSGGDFFPWVFRQQKIGPLIGTRTWGGLVKSSVHYPLADGGALTAPDNAIFDPHTNTWVAENTGIPPDIEVRQNAKSLGKGGDPQLERAVEEALKLLQQQGEFNVTPPPFATPAIKK